jgi:hydrogenase/urease accessory protein HupE
MTKLLIGVLALLCCIIQLGSAAPSAAHELRPAYLDIREATNGDLAVVWKTPALGEMRLGLYVRLPEACTPTSEPIKSFEGDAYFERFTARCPGGLKGRTLAIDGLRTSLTDVLVRIASEDGGAKVARLTPETPSLTIPAAQSAMETATTYFLLGVEHILLGFDHLLFVLALMLLVRDRWTLLKTITAFTLAHSVTLSGAALGYLGLPQAPVEATIALSIAFVASELVRSGGSERHMSERYPWLVAFIFGLLHGFGFAGALKEIGLPPDDVPVALLSFNLGVEAGQLLFVAAALLVFRGLTALVSVPFLTIRRATAYVIGTTSAFWLISRIESFWT